MQAFSDFTSATDFCTGKAQLFQARARVSNVMQTVRKLLCKDRRLFPRRRATADFARFDLEGGL
jgi:hypothetical protein